MLRVGLTGGIASGKSEVARAFAERGAVVIDADRLARDVVAPGTPGCAAVVERFGADVLQLDGRLDRGRLAGIVFADPDARAALNAIVHPLVRLAAAAMEQAAPARSIVVHDIPLLVETGQQGEFDVVVVVAATRQRQRQRLIDFRGLTAAAADARLDAQAPLADKLAVADLVIDNNGTLEALAREVDTCWAHLAQRAEDQNR